MKWFTSHTPAEQLLIVVAVMLIILKAINIIYERSKNTRNNSRSK